MECRGLQEGVTLSFDEIVAKALMWALIGGQTEFVALLLPEVRMLTDTQDDM